MTDKGGDQTPAAPPTLPSGRKSQSPQISLHEAESVSPQIQSQLANSVQKLSRECPVPFVWRCLTICPLEPPEWHRHCPKAAQHSEWQQRAGSHMPVIWH